MLVFRFGFGFCSVSISVNERSVLCILPQPLLRNCHTNIKAQSETDEQHSTPSFKHFKHFFFRLFEGKQNIQLKFQSQFKLWTGCDQ